jgi:hypothetical protein
MENVHVPYVSDLRLKYLQRLADLAVETIMLHGKVTVFKAQWLNLCFPGNDFNVLVKNFEDRGYTVRVFQNNPMDPQAYATIEDPKRPIQAIHVRT